MSSWNSHVALVCEQGQSIHAGAETRYRLRLLQHGGHDRAGYCGRKVVKYAVATESNTVVYIKVAREVDGNPAALTDGQLEGLTSYMNEIKDAGVSVQLRNEPADQMQIALLIYYDPTLLTIDANGNGSQNGKDPRARGHQAVIENLPFNGMFRKSDLMAALQALPCVEVADIKSVTVKPRNGAEWQTVEGYDGHIVAITASTLTVDYQPYNAIE